jgi:hypothetical protein
MVATAWLNRFRSSAGAAVTAGVSWYGGRVPGIVDDGRQACGAAKLAINATA